MILAFNLADIVLVPFGFLMRILYQLVNNYGVALILFTIFVKLIMLPMTIKSKKSMLQMSRLSPHLEALKKKYANDPQKQNEAVRQLYKDEGVSAGGGCLWSLLPLLILIPLYSIVRDPIVYILGESSATAKEIVNALKELVPEGTFTEGNSYYQQMIAAPLIPEYAQQLLEKLPNLSEATLQGVNFTFFGINLAQIPSYNVFAWKVWNWATIGAFLLPVISAGSQVLTSLLTQKMNNSVVTDEKGLHDKETAKNSQANQTAKSMLYMMPIMTLIFGFSMPAALSIYWIVQGLVSTGLDIVLTKVLRKDYDNEDSLRRLRALQEEAELAEKERIRAERRAANPDGITENTSKKKMQQKLQKEKEAAKAAAAREYAISRGTYVEEENNTATTLSGIPDRPFCKGRAYDPNRYASQNTEE